MLYSRALLLILLCFLLPPSVLPTGLTCEGFDKYMCKSGSCVEKSNVCDYSNDCFDNSDELDGICNTYKFRCSFERGPCSHWKEDVEDNTDWALRRASSGGTEDLPTRDHTWDSITGHYLALDTSRPNVTDYVGRLISPVISGDVEECHLRFWYQAIGDNPGVINVYRRKSYYEDGLHLEASIKDTPKNIWVKLTLPFGDGTHDEDFQIVIEGLVNGDHEGTLAVDDFSMTPLCKMSDTQELPGQDEIPIRAFSHHCHPGELTCNDGGCYHPTEACNFIDDCHDGTDEQDCSKDCDFEDDDDALCGWFESPANTVHWVRTGFPVPYPGPSADRHNRTDTFDLLASKTTEEGGQVVILESHVFSSIASDCFLSFDLYMANEGEYISTLYVDQKTEGGLNLKTEGDAVINQPSEPLAIIMANQINWMRVENSLYRARDFTIIFKAVLGSGKAYVGLDEIAFLNCSAPEREECHSSMDLQCIDGSCVAQQFICDANYDCIDKTDEWNCPTVKGNCNFDGDNWLDECSWQQRSDDDLQWSHDNSSHDTNYGPAHDHTLGHYGSYVYVGNKKTPKGLKASIMPIHVHPPSTDICYLRFWFYSHAEVDPEPHPDVDFGSLNVYMEDLNGSRWLIMWGKGNFDAVWQESVILVDSWSDHHIVFEVTTGDPEYTYIAIDDVSFTPECESGVGPPIYIATCDPNEKQCDSGDCLPKDFFCDQFIDCIDGSDESEANCATTTTAATTTTTTTTTTGNPSPCKKDTEFSCGDTDDTCLPALLLCDGVTDCPNATDELQCPGKTPCSPGFVFCADSSMMEDPCLPVADLCDGIIQCVTHEADESMCEYCTSEFCRNGGLCQINRNGAPSCSCSRNYRGNRCELWGPKGLSGGAIFGIVFGTLVCVAALIGSIFYCIRHKRTSVV